MAERGITLTKPRRFRFKRASYRPDFYSPSECVYYEVIGSRQRAEFLRAYFDLMEIFHPEIVVRPVYPNGRPYVLTHSRRLARKWIPTFTPLGAVLDDRGMQISDLAQELGIASSTLSNILTGQRSYSQRSHAAALLETWLANANGQHIKKGA